MSQIKFLDLAGLTTYDGKIKEWFKTGVVDIADDAIQALFIAPTSYELVDLGLPSGLMWGACNIGASKPEEYGNYFAWGELSSKNSYIDSNYKFGGEVMSKYNSTDGLTQLLSVDDIAHISQGDSWHIPTKDDVSELIENTTSEWIADYNSTGVSGRLFTGVNGNSIFIPASGCISGEEHLGGAGYCQAWSSSLSTNNETRALCLYFDAEQVFRASDFRSQGFVIRPVKSK